jgi:hypothetical protein
MTAPLSKNFSWKDLSMDRRAIIEETLLATIRLITGINSTLPALGGLPVKPPAAGQDEVEHTIAEFFHAVVAGKTPASRAARELLNEFGNVREIFVAYYAADENFAFFEARRPTVLSGTDPETVAQAVSELWAPEIAMPDNEIFRRWQLKDVKPNPRPYQPVEVLVPLNAMYGPPENVPADLPQSIKDEWTRVQDQPDPVFFDYDHPVVLFSPDKQHELVLCLQELDRDIAYEKSQGVFPANYKLMVPVSVSVTHPRLDRLAGMWLNHVLKEKKYAHLDVYILTEEKCRRIRQGLGFTSANPAIFSVLGKYANHFNVLKYFPLLAEKTHGIRAGMKLDTDEGTRTRELKELTGKTWFETLCHPYWGGTALDYRGQPVYLGVNEGEYINEKDMNEKGYAACLREPDVKIPKTYIDPTIFFNKGFAHTRATALYNKKVDKLEDFISHPVVKGGGYGVDNAAVQRCAPFTLSAVGRAEDQQFYMAGLSRGVAAIFPPNLRIAHYKMSVAVTEHSTEVSRFIGDLFRLVIFQHIVEILGVKHQVDPMPGVFAGKLARAQAFCNLLYKSHGYFAVGKKDFGRELFIRGRKELTELEREIDAGDMKKLWAAEQAEWERFVKAVDATPRDKLETLLKEIRG